MEIYKLKRRVASDGVLRLELPVNWPDTDVEIAVIIQPRVAERTKARSATDGARSTRTHSFAEVRRKHARAYEPWDDAEDQRLRSLYESSLPQEAIARILKRQPSAIRSRLRKLGLTDSPPDDSKSRR